MKVRLSRSYTFEASHRLENMPQDHSCYRLHGHGYKVDIEVAGDVDATTGMLIDFLKLDSIVKPIIELLDHRHLNDIQDMEFTTTEYIACWIWGQLKPRLSILEKIRVSETANTNCEYEGD